MTFQIRDLSATRKECTIDYSKSDLQNKFKAKLNAIKGQVQLAGFRKGKAPISLVEEKHGPLIIQELLDEKIQSCWTEVCKDQKVLERPEITVVPLINKLSDIQSDVSITLGFDVIPQFDLIEPQKLIKTLNIELAKPIAITQESKDSYRKVLELQCSKDEVVARPAAVGDKLEINVLYTETGKTENDLELVLDATQTQQEFIDAVLGMSAGESRSFTYTPESYDPSEESSVSKEVAKSLAVTVTVNSVHAMVPPTLDQLCAFVRDLNGATGENGEEKLNEWIESTILELNSQQAFRINEKKLTNAVAEHYSFEIPSVHTREMSFDTAEKKEAVFRAIRMNYIIGAYSELFDIQPSHEDVDFFAKIFAQDMGLPLQYLSQILQSNKKVQQRFQDSVVEKSVIKYLLEGTTMKTATVAAPAAIEAGHDHTNCTHEHHHHDHENCTHNH